MRVVSLVTILKSKSWKTNLQGSSRFSTKKSIASQAPTFNTKDVKMTANLPLLNAANVVFTKEPNWGFGKDSNFDQKLFYQGNIITNSKFIIWPKIDPERKCVFVYLFIATYFFRFKKGDRDGQ